ncbi:MAG: hypothetical protein A3C90_02095 [Candidatus Magasanikbacteria bacterium RIFCSPHIGHO2_02_FULL_51_14]|uniref:Fido domain-containing protein n=1 Tax=Candidatus Magasanikbacteria bacterium RIFCSPHIGHO2_02_FULL_51_14 TaxID=1798683 RepID=A0A1F6MQE3_9BACT|nr:MAG: hypothetical protein A3C90_02095 [Candidatus Magasanikbacteria bacterium RIFCSPHIGHO2_02_FULL_51_14]
MTTAEKLRLLQQISGLTQQRLAEKIGVTFVALNRWMNGKAHPRPAAEKKIDTLLAGYTGERVAPESARDARKMIITEKQNQRRRVLKTILQHPDIFDQFALSLTYHSCRIEGSTLTEQETAAVLFDNVALPRKSLAEQLGAKNHQTAFEYLLHHLGEGGALNEPFILRLHAMLMNGIRDDAGLYRRHGVRIVGSNVPAANYLKMPELMRELVKDIGKKTHEPIARAAQIHARFEQIHPFADGNGRVGRLLMNAMLVRNDIAPAVIREQDRRAYYRSLQQAQLKQVYEPLEEFISDAILAGYRILERRSQFVLSLPPISNLYYAAISPASSPPFSD